MKKILVTGANGQLGSELKDILGANNEQVLYTDVAQLDITKLDLVRAFIKEHKVTDIINCAAYTAVDKAETDQDIAYMVNCIAPKNLATVAAEENCRLIHVSTDYVFSGEACTPYVESDPTSPLGVYGRTKLAGEEAVTDSGCDSVIIRTSWLYSAYGNNFVKTMMRLGKERDQLNVVFDQVGTPTYAGDLAAAIVKLIQTEELADVSGLYHFSNEGVCSWYDFAQEIMDQEGITCNVQPILSSQYPTPVRRPSFSVLDKAKIKKDFHITIPYWKHSLIMCLRKLNSMA
ncbi:MAG: dTDP-4-dehydrorhamnose reductase [Tannerellaceae bacterium]